MPGKARQAPRGWIKPERVQTVTNGKWKAPTLRQMIRKGRWAEVTGLGDEHVMHGERMGKRPAPVFISKQATEQMRADAKKYNVPFSKLARKLGVSVDDLRLVVKPDMKKVGGRVWHTTRAESKRLMLEKASREESLSAQQAGRLWRRDKATVRRWIKSELIPKDALVPDGVFFRIDRAWARANRHRFGPAAGRFVKKPDRAPVAQPSREDMRRRIAEIEATLTGRLEREMNELRVSGLPRQKYLLKQARIIRDRVNLTNERTALEERLRDDNRPHI